MLLVAAVTISRVNANMPGGARGELVPRAYLPLVAAPEPTPGPDGWITILQEGFETPPGPLWSFLDSDGAEHGTYYWGRRTCRPYSGNTSAWAVGGGADGEALPCDSDYPDNANSWMVYGPFSLVDARAAELRFELWLDHVPVGDEFCWLASSDRTTWAGPCLNADPGGWTPLSLDLSDVDPLVPGASMLDKPQVWIAFGFVSDDVGHAAEGAYVDDVMIRKCREQTCLSAPAMGRTPDGWRWYTQTSESANARWRVGVAYRNDFAEVKHR